MSIISAVDMLTEIDRELSQRARVYRRLVEQGKMKQAAADRQVEIMRAIRTAIEERAATERLI
jgi:hypothetical protein